MLVTLAYILLASFVILDAMPAMSTADSTRALLVEREESLGNRGPQVRWDGVSIDINLGKAAEDFEGFRIVPDSVVVDESIRCSTLWCIYWV